MVTLLLQSDSVTQNDQGLCMPPSPLQLRLTLYKSVVWRWFTGPGDMFNQQGVEP